MRWKEKLFYVVNIYAPCSLALKIVMWNSLIVLKSKVSDEEWCFVGDFNVVTCYKERKSRGMVMRNSDMCDFPVLLKTTYLLRSRV